MMRKTAREIYQEYEHGLNYNEDTGLTDDVRQNELFIQGKQWEGVNAPDIDKPVFNILKRVKNYLISMLVSDDIGVSLGLFNRIEDDDARIKLRAVEMQVDQVMEYADFRAKMRTVLSNAAVDGDGVLHVYFDPTVDTGWDGVSGMIDAEIYDNTSIFFGNTETPEIQKQPYILIESRRMLSEVREKMQNTPGADDPQMAVEDMPTNESYQGEVEQNARGKVTVIRKYWKESGRVHFMEITKTAVVVPDTDTGMRLYPVAYMPWERRRHSCHGVGVVSGLIPNQIAINKMAAMAQRFIRQQAFPRVFYDSTKLPRWQEGVKPLAVTGSPRDIVYSDSHNTNMSGQVGEYIDRFIQQTRDLMGASDAALGTIRPDNTSAIIATQKSTAIPLELVKQEYYKFVEDFVRITIDMMRVYYGNRMVVAEDEEGEKQEISLDFSFLDNWVLEQNVEIGTAAYWSELSLIQTLDGLFQKGLVDPLTYLEAIPVQLIPNKSKIVADMRQKIEQQQAQQAEAAEVMAALGGQAPEGMEAMPAQ